MLTFSLMYFPDLDSADDFDPLDQDDDDRDDDDRDDDDDADDDDEGPGFESVDLIELQANQVELMESLGRKLSTIVRDTMAKHLPNGVCVKIRFSTPDVDSLERFDDRYHIPKDGDFPDPEDGNFNLPSGKKEAFYELGGFSVEVEVPQQGLDLEDPEAGVSYGFMDSDRYADYAFYMKRDFLYDTKSNRWICKADKMIVHPALAGKGIGNEVSENSEALFKASGISEVALEAGGNVGFYNNAKRGFDFLDHRMADTMNATFVRYYLGFPNSKAIAHIRFGDHDVLPIGPGTKLSAPELANLKAFDYHGDEIRFPIRLNDGSETNVSLGKAVFFHAHNTGVFKVAWRGIKQLDES